LISARSWSTGIWPWMSEVMSLLLLAMLMHQMFEVPGVRDENGLTCRRAGGDVIEAADGVAEVIDDGHARIEEATAGQLEDLGSGSCHQVMRFECAESSRGRGG